MAYRHCPPESWFVRANDYAATTFSRGNRVCGDRFPLSHEYQEAHEQNRQPPKLVPPLFTPPWVIPVASTAHHRVQSPGCAHCGVVIQTSVQAEESRSPGCVRASLVGNAVAIWVTIVKALPPRRRLMPGPHRFVDHPASFAAGLAEIYAVRGRSPSHVRCSWLALMNDSVGPQSAYCVNELPTNPDAARLATSILVLSQNGRESLDVTQLTRSTRESCHYWVRRSVQHAWSKRPRANQRLRQPRSRMTAPHKGTGKWSVIGDAMKGERTFGRHRGLRAIAVLPGVADHAGVAALVV